MAWSVIWQHGVFAVLLKNKPTRAQTNMAAERLLFFCCFILQFLGLTGNEKQRHCCGLLGCLTNKFLQTSDERPLNLIKMSCKWEAVAEIDATS